MVDHIGKMSGKSLRRAAGCGGVRRWSHGLYEAPVDPADASPGLWELPVAVAKQQEKREF